VFGVQINLHALAASAYPTEIRATGVGWALGAGRIGSILGPVLGGLLLTVGWGMAGYFAACAGLMLVAGAALSRVRYDDRAARLTSAAAG
jgi:MFS transporter, AAHS family, 4-hydroxybenzoate transporter